MPATILKNCESLDGWIPANHGPRSPIMAIRRPFSSRWAQMRSKFSNDSIGKRCWRLVRYAESHPRSQGHAIISVKSVTNFTPWEELPSSLPDQRRPIPHFLQRVGRFRANFDAKTFKGLADRRAISLFIRIVEFAQPTPHEQGNKNSTNRWLAYWLLLGTVVDVTSF